MSMLLQRLKRDVSEPDSPGPIARLQLPANLDLVHLARQTLGDKGREMEMLGHFDEQAGAVLRRLRALGAAEAAPVARILAASARTVGAFAVGAASDAYAATLSAGLPESDRARALDILSEEIGIVRAAISDLLPR